MLRTETSFMQRLPFHFRFLLSSLHLTVRLLQQAPARLRPGSGPAGLSPRAVVQPTKIHDAESLISSVDPCSLAPKSPVVGFGKLINKHTNQSVVDGGGRSGM